MLKLSKYSRMCILFSLEIKETYSMDITALLRKIDKVSFPLQGGSFHWTNIDVNALIIKLKDIYHYL